MLNRISLYLCIFSQNNVLRICLEHKIYSSLRYLERSARHWLIRNNATLKPIWDPAKERLGMLLST
jgi:hypothetical protein